ncbi:MAG: amidohydrolase [Bacteroidales bacterium]|nr:amidohydrolase [Bacteroidales bacterium]
MKKITTLALSILLTIATVYAQGTKNNERIINEVESQLEAHKAIYEDIHQNPELSLMEFKTAKKMATQLNNMGFEVTTNVGGNGVVGVLKNGKGPVIMLRTDMDALPISENTGLEYASKAVLKDFQGNSRPVMHACGHDMHMTLWLGTLQTLVSLKKYWNGTILAVAQPAEEVSGGSAQMITDGLFKKFPTPDYALAYHVASDLPAGKIGYASGAFAAGVNNADIYVYGVGGHGAMPHSAIDPIVLSAQIIMGLQTVVSRDINPVNPAVVTVGSIHGGTKHNIIPDEVKMELTLRFFSDEVYSQIQESIFRICEGMAKAAGVPDNLLPMILISDQFTPPTINDPRLVARAVESMKDMLGDDNIVSASLGTAAEDFGKYGRTEENIPIAMFLCGTIGKQRYNKHLASGEKLPGLHNSAFYPDFEPSYKAGVSAMASAMMGLFNNN